MFVMSAFNDKCVITTADSKKTGKKKNTIIIDISDHVTEYNIFDLDQSVVESNNLTDSDIEQIISKLKI